jgi:cell wall-associated NlpC family hydrolase
VWGGSTPATGFDSAGLTQYAYAQVGVALPRTAEGQFGSGAAVSRESLRLGDLVFFRDASGYVFHVGGQPAGHLHHPQPVLLPQLEHV